MPKTVTLPRVVHIIGLSVLLSLPALDARAQQLPINPYTTADGLPHNTINHIVRDSRGFVWFCTDEGLSRFDGHTFTNFGTEQGLPHAGVADLLETRDGEYWVATRGGLVRFDPKGRPERRVPSESRAAAAAPMFALVPIDDRGGAARAITVLLQGRDGTIWSGTDNGLYRLEESNSGRSLRPIEIGIPHENPEQRIVADLLEDASGSLWIAAPSGLYRRMPDGSHARYTTADGLPNDYVQDLLEDHSGQLWAGTRLNGFFRFRAGATLRVPIVDLAFTYPGDLPTSWVYQLFEASDHRFWIGTARGLVEFLPDGDDQGRRFHAYSTTNGLSYFEITALAEDQSGNLWLGTNTAGAMKFAVNGFTAYGERDGLRQVSSLFHDRAGSLCFRGTVLGDARTSVFEGATLPLVSTDQPAYHSRLGCFDGQRFTGFLPDAIVWDAAGWVSERVTLQTRHGEWWVGTGRGLYRFAAAVHLADIKRARPLAVYTTTDGLATPQVYRLFEDSAGNVWISTVSSSTNGLARWDSATGRIRDMANAPGLPSFKNALARAFAEDAFGNVWIGFDGVLARYGEGRFTLFTASDGLPPGAIRDMYEDPLGRLWLASATSGLLRVDDAGAKQPTFVTVTTAQGLSSNNIEVITGDAAGRIYAGGGNGLDRFDPATGRVKHFTRSDGLPNGAFRAAFRDRAGVLWFGMTSGLARLAPGPERPAAPPWVLISGLRISGVPQPISALGERDMSLRDLAPQQKQMQIDFIGLKFGTGEVLRYQYQLKGIDAEWSALSEQRTVTYASLAPGPYTFLVRAADSDGLVSEPAATITFRIQRPVWQQAWFLGIAMLLLFGTIHTLYRYRVARLLDIANMRTRIATDLHDDIGANLTRIALLSEVATKTYVEGRRADPGASLEVFETARQDGPLVSIARIARESVASMSDIVWAINPARDTLLDLTRRMRQHADEIFTLRDIDLRFDATGAQNERRLGVDVRRDLLLIFKESVNNAARHSGCTRVEIDFRMGWSCLMLTVADNGAGFDTSVESEGQGLMSMRRRARKMKGVLDIRSCNGTGTTVRLTMPL